MIEKTFPISLENDISIKDAIPDYKPPITPVEKLAEWHSFDQLFAHDFKDLSIFHNFYMEHTYTNLGDEEYFVKGSDSVVS